MKKRNNAKKSLLVCALFVFIGLTLFSGIRLLEATVLSTAGEELGFESKTVSRNGVDYFPRQDIVTILVMGIDRSGPVTDSEAYNNSGASDVNVLVIIDETNQKCDLLYLNRDTMVEMPVLGVGGRYAGTYYGQLALAHTYGSGLKDSCENVRETISALLGDIQIDYYVSLNMDAISIMNDAVGGVTVEVTEDFSQVDPTITMGTLTLQGEQSVNYVRTRKDVGDQLNLSRIERQQDYINGFVDAFLKAYETDKTLAASLYEAVAPYLVTDLSVNALNGMIERYGDFNISRVETPVGDNVMGEQYFEFYADEAALEALYLELFYAPK